MNDFSFWEYDSYHRIWDVCIIGSGINGISAGISLLEKKPGLKVLIVDRWFLPLGASTRNAGFACFGSPSEILDDISAMGEDAALSLVRKRWQGLLKLRERIQNSNAQYADTGGYELYQNKEFEKIEDRLGYLNDFIGEAIGKENVFQQISVPAGIKAFSHAVFNPYEGQLHPVRMMEQLKMDFIRKGGKIWTGLNIQHIAYEKDHVVFESRYALPLRAKSGIISTNAFVSELLPELDVQGARNHVLVTEPVESLPWKGCFHHDRGFYYFRNIGNRILLGGARNQDLPNENTAEFGGNPVIIEALEEFLYRHLADRGKTKIEFQWSGIIAVGKEKLPLVQEVGPGLFIGVRCSGMGIALASLIGEELAGLVLQQAD